MKKKRKGLALLCGLLLSLSLTCCSAPKEISLQEVHEQIKEAYGENYLPSMPYDSQILETIYGVKPEWIEEFVAEGPAMSAHVDTFIAIKATEGNADNVKNALEAYKQSNIESGLNYPMNMAKIEQSQVYQIDDYVFYLLLGAYYEGEDENEEPTFYQEQTKIGLDVLKQYE